MSNDTILTIFFVVLVLGFGSLAVYGVYLDRKRRKTEGFGSSVPDDAPRCLVCDSEEITLHDERGYGCEACGFESTADYEGELGELVLRCRELANGSGQLDEARYLFESIGYRRPRFPSDDTRDAREAVFEAFELVEDQLGLSITELEEVADGQPDAIEEVRAQLGFLESRVRERQRDVRARIRSRLTDRDA
jgi:hypothetical protein